MLGKIQAFYWKVIVAIRNAYWWVRHRTINRFHTLNLKTKPGYMDVDYRMTLAVFELLRQYAEEEDGFAVYLHFIETKGEGQDEFSMQWFKNCQADYDKLYSAYLWWKAKKTEWENAVVGVEEEINNRATEHMVNVIRLRSHLWT